MSDTETTTNTLSVTEASAQPQVQREEPPVWPSAATSGSGAYISQPEPKGEAVAETGAEG